LVLAFHQNWDIFNKHIHYVFWIVVIHNLLAYVLGFQTARIFKLEFRERKTLAIETGIQNSGLGLLLIFGFFQGLGGMALLAAFWGVWDILSGLLLAFYWGMRENKELAKIQKRTDL
jgi:BASS family bile acid:Na+ symporter